MSEMNFYDAVDVISGGTPNTKIPEYWGGDIPWLSVVDFGDKNKYVYETEKHITQAGVDNSSTKVLNKNDIIISARGTVGAMAMLDSPMAFNQSCFGLRAKPDIMDQDYLFYFLKSYMRNISQKSQGSVFQTINLDTFKAIDIDVPDMRVQKAISELLSAVDDKIESNTTICADLEGLAKLIYNYWFVQFDFPDDNGKPYKSSGGKMVWNEELKRQIPDGWTVKTIRSYVSRITNGLNPRSNFKLGSGSNYYVTTKNLDEFGNIDFSTCDMIDDAALRAINSRSDLKAGDILFSGIATVGRVYYIDKTPSNWNINEAIFTLRPSSTNTSEFLYEFFISEEIQKQADLKAIGSSQRCLTQDSFLDIPCIYYPQQLQKLFAEMISDMIAKIKLCQEESRNLTALREFLLPMLMNGQITVGEAKEHIVKIYPKAEEQGMQMAAESRDVERQNGGEGM